MTRPPNYQDRIVGWAIDTDPIVQLGHRECALRWRYVSRVLSFYRRPFTLLDIGADLGYFSIRAVTEYDAVAVAIEGGRQLLDALTTLPITRTYKLVALQRRITLDELDILATCEHFDVVLALNVLHHFPDPERAFSTILSLGTHTIIETPGPDDAGACGGAAKGVLYRLCQRGALNTHARKHLGDTPSHVTPGAVRPMYLFENTNAANTGARHHTLARQYIDAPAIATTGFSARVESNLTEARIHLPASPNRPDGQVRDLLPGINLRTYQRYGGVFPHPHYIADRIRATPLDPTNLHADIWPWNFVLDGLDVHLIDGHDAKAQYPDDATQLKLTAQQIYDMEHPNPQCAPSP